MSAPGASGPASADGPKVVVSVGTDHHRFDRLVDWIDEWTARHPEVPVLVQRGTSRRPATADSVDLIGYAELVSAMAGAEIVVVQGGPAGILDARGAGRRPIVVPRRPDLDEHVDGHQITFARWMAERGQVDLAEDAATLHRLMDDALADPAAFRVEEQSDATAAVEAFAAAVDPLLGRRRRG